MINLLSKILKIGSYFFNEERFLQNAVSKIEKQIMDLDEERNKAWDKQSVRAMQRYESKRNRLLRRKAIAEKLRANQS